MPKAKFNPEKMVYSVEEAAAMLSVSRPRLYAIVNSGKLRAVKLGKRTLFKKSEIERFLDALPPYETETGRFGTTGRA